MQIDDLNYMDFTNKYNEYFDSWKDKFSNDEWFFSNFIEQNIKKLSAEEAFTLLPEAVEIYLNQTDKELYDFNLQLIMEMARQSQTTELPNILEEKWQQIMDKANENNNSQEKFWLMELKNWYRR